MDDQNKNLILATALSFVVILVWFLLFPPEEPVVDPAAPTAVATAPASPVPGATEIADAPGAVPGVTTQADNRAAALAEVVRVPILTNRLEGSISLTGGRIDDLKLRDYRETLDPGSDVVTLLTPEGVDDAYYALFGWSPGTGLTIDQVPTAETVWTAPEDATLGLGSDVTL